MSYEGMKNKNQKLKQEITELQLKLGECPEGNLNCVNNKGYYKWYYHKDSMQLYIPKKQRKLAEQLAVKKYMSALLEDKKREKEAIELYLKYCVANDGLAEKLLSNKEYQNLLSNYFRPVDSSLSEWMQASYETNNKYPEQKILKSCSGNMVRSKSEMMIDSSLYIHKIPFRYEDTLALDDIILYPDFTIRHPKTGEYFYWEHFGLMDDPVYCKNTFSKLQLYTTNNIVPDINLITTYETRESPLSMEKIERIITEHFIE